MGADNSHPLTPQEEVVADAISKALNDATSSIESTGITKDEIAFCFINEGVSLLGDTCQISSEVRAEAIKIVNDCVDCNFGFVDFEFG